MKNTGLVARYDSVIWGDHSDGRAGRNQNGIGFLAQCDWECTWLCGESSRNQDDYERTIPKERRTGKGSRKPKSRGRRKIYIAPDDRGSGTQKRAAAQDNRWQSSAHDVRERRCLNCGKLFIPLHITIDKDGIHPAGATCCCMRCTEAYYHIRIDKSRLNR